MNQKEWKTSEKYKCKYKWYNKTRRLQRSLQYNPDPKASIIHHLRDTEEQRTYNDEHYELWGFEIDENGNEHFEYGKYVVFVTKEEHSKIHSQSDETRKKISENSAKPALGKHLSDEAKHHLSVINTGKRRSEETIEKIRAGNLGKRQTEETKQKISIANSGKKRTDESRRKMSESHKGKPASNKGVKMSDIARQHMRDAAKNRAPMSEDVANKIRDRIAFISEEYKRYKENGGELSWNSFQKEYHTIMNES